MNGDLTRREFLKSAALAAAAATAGLAGLKPAEAQGPAALPYRFVDRTAELGLQLGNDQACWADLNNDGWPDLITGGTVWLNNQGKGFTKVQEGLGSCVAADFDNDGYVDLFSWSNLQVYHNKGNGTFTPVPMPKLPATVSRGACWGDFDGDGFVDLYVGGYEDWDRDITYPNMILMNQGGEGLKLVWSEVRYRARGVTACDFDEDGSLDIYVSDYRLQPNVLWLNDGHGHFQDVAAAYNVVATSAGFDGGHSIGAAWGDFDNDGHFDLFAGNFAHVDDRGDQPKSRFLRNLGPAGKYHFQDLGTCGVFYQESYASPAAGDYDNDGLLDLYFTTVYGVASFGRPNYPVLYHNDGAFSFRDVTTAAGLAHLPPTYQAAWADFDLDGWLDLVTGGRLFRNEGLDPPGHSGGVPPGHHWLEVRLYGDGDQVNWSAIGAQVRIPLEDRILSRQVEAGTGEGNQNDLTLHFGLGARTAPVDLGISWPGGRKQTVSNVAVDRVVAVRFGA
jgi:hypothetical protein